MAKPIHHATNSHRKMGGEFADHWQIHHLMDLSKSAWAKMNHRAVFHHDYGVDLVSHMLRERLTCDIDFARKIAEEHIKEDLNFIPTTAGWADELGEHKLLWRRNKQSAEVHAELSRMKLGGEASEYIAVHALMGIAKPLTEVIFHNAFGCFVVEEYFGGWFVNSVGKTVSYRELAELHVLREYNTIPTLQDWLSGMTVKPWMAGSRNMLKGID